jgi:hypothetical protein
MGNPKEAGFVQLTDAPPDYYSDALPLLSQPGQHLPPRQSQPRLPDIRTVSAPRNRHIPSSFNGYYQKKLTSTFHLGEHADQPLFAVKTHTGWSGVPGVVLHSGPTDKDPPLAAAGNETGLESERHKDTLVLLPPPPGAENESSYEFLRHDPSFKTETYRFTIDVGLGGDKETLPENFEWRPSDRQEIQQLVKRNKYILGWELVRLGSRVDIRDGEGSSGITPDGEEIVAVWARYAGWSLTKAFKFQFMGSGASGELGERWAVMAVISALRIWCLEGMGQTDEGLGNASM